VYYLIVELTDSNPYNPMSSQYLLKVIVLNRMIFEKQKQINEIKKWKQRIQEIPYESVSYDHNTIMGIQSITNTGLLTLNFSDPLIVPTDWLQINQTVL